MAFESGNFGNQGKRISGDFSKSRGEPPRQLNEKEKVDNIVRGIMAKAASKPNTSNDTPPTPEV